MYTQLIQISIDNIFKRTGITKKGNKYFGLRISYLVNYCLIYNLIGIKNGNMPRNVIDFYF